MTKSKGKKVAAPSSKKATLTLPSSNYFRVRSNQFSKMGLPKRMDDGLAADDWQMLKDNRLGGIVKIGTNAPYCPALIHYFIERQLKTLKKCETWYELQGRLLRFSIKEFCLVTGLKCAGRNRDFEEEDHKDAIRSFFGREKVKVSDLPVMWEVAKAKERSDKKRLKLALLIIVECILLPKDVGKGVKGWVVSLVQDLNRFFNYSWGKVCYEATHESLDGALVRKVEQGVKGGNERSGYSINGFPLAFQIWIYEAVPSVINYFANRIPGVNYPRCARWKSTDPYIPYDRIKHTMTKSKRKKVATPSSKKKSVALWSLKESHEDIGEAKEEHRMVQLEKMPLLSIHHFESSSEVFMRVVALKKSFPTHVYMRQSDERELEKVHFKTEQNVES